jgi:hypothetical protein
MVPIQLEATPCSSSGTPHSSVEQMYTLLKPHHLLAYYPMTHNLYDYAPSGSCYDGYAQHGVNHGAQYKKNHQDASDGAYYFDGKGYIEVPINVNPELHPKITMGAWVQPLSTAGKSTMYVFLFRNSIFTHYFGVSV